jgi:hypothetical protein
MKLFLAGLLLAGLVGCGGETKKETPKTPPKEAVKEVKDAAKEGAKEVKDGAKEAVKEVKDAAKEVTK